MKKLILSGIVFSIVTSSTGFCLPSQETFSSPSEAARALSLAASEENLSALTKIFGTEFLKEINTGDETAGKFRLHQLAERMNEEQNLVASSNGLTILEIGKSRWPFPVPLMERDGKWFFNSYIGAEEVKNRRIGENEIRAIKISRFYVDAQNLYRAKDRDGDGELEYATKLISSPGKRDGL